MCFFVFLQQKKWNFVCLLYSNIISNEEIERFYFFVLYKKKNDGYFLSKKVIMNYFIMAKFFFLSLFKSKQFYL